MYNFKPDQKGFKVESSPKRSKEYVEKYYCQIAGCNLISGIYAKTLTHAQIIKRGTLRKTTCYFTCIKRVGVNVSTKLKTEKGKTHHQCQHHKMNQRKNEATRPFSSCLSTKIWDLPNKGGRA